MTTKTVLLTGRKIKWTGRPRTFEHYDCPSYPAVDEVGRDKDGHVWIREADTGLDEKGYAIGAAHCVHDHEILVEHNDAWLTLDAFVAVMKDRKSHPSLGRKVLVRYYGTKHPGRLVLVDEYPPAHDDGSDADGDFWVALDGQPDDKFRLYKRDEIEFVDEDAEHAAAVDKLIDEVISEEKAAYIVRGSYGELYLDAAGNVERYVDSDGDNEYGYITKFDLTTLSGREVDIIYAGYWTKDGEYVRP